jgi:putative ABC transport system ATP-binding protein
LVKLYRTKDVETVALQQVSLEVDAGEFLSIMGPSGCGKSTLLNILGAIDGLNEGKYLFMGEDISGFAERQRARIRKNNIGFVFQSFNLIDELTVFENIELPLLYARTPPADREAKVTAIIEKLGLTERANHYPQQLSGGQQQRVAVARAIVNSPKLILADEPTGNLDSENGAEVLRLLRQLNGEGTTVVMVTHSAENAAVGSRTVRMLDGRIVEEKRAH